MSISLGELPEWAQQQVLQKYGKMQQEKRQKYGAEKQNVGSIRFDSKKEARRFGELRIMRRSGQIEDLRVHPQFTLQEAYTTEDGERIRAIRYEADFSYRIGGVAVVEDVKSEATRKDKTYRMKRKLMQERYGITVREV